MTRTTRLRRTPDPVTKPLTYTVEQAAHLLGISRSHAYELIARDELPSLHLGRRVVVPRVSLEELLRQTWRGDGRRVRIDLDT